MPSLSHRGPESGFAPLAGSLSDALVRTLALA